MARTRNSKLSNLVASLHDFKENMCAQPGKRTKLAIARVQVDSADCRDTESYCFTKYKETLAHQVTLSHRNFPSRLCVFTDPLDTVCSEIITQLPRTYLGRIQKAQRYESFAFLPGRFNSTQLGWPVLERKAYAVMATFEKRHWFVATSDCFQLHMDQETLVFVFDPLSALSDLSQTITRRVLRWTVRLRVDAFTYLHIKEKENL